MSESLSNTLKDFKYSVVKPIKFYNKVKSLPEYSNISYSQFRTRNISFDIFEAAFLNISNEGIISPAQIRNMFRFLSNNLKGTRDIEIKRIIIKIEKLKISLVTKLCELDPEQDKISIDNINTILVELKILKNIIIDNLKINHKNVEKEIEFDVLMDDLLYSDDLNTSTLLYTLFYNLPILGNDRDNGKKFNQELYKAILIAIHENNERKKNYYITLANLVNQANIYNLEKKVMNICGFTRSSYSRRTRLAEKISRFDYDSNKGRYKVKDYIVTIDNKSTSKFDDAISIEKLDNESYILGIHIADVYSLGLLPSSNASIKYRSNASLLENTEKNAISLFVEISNKGLIIDKKILMTSIEVKNNMLYDDISKVLYNKNDDILFQTVINLIGLYNIIENTKLPDYPGPSSIAHALVQKYMLLYGCVVSDLASKNNYPILYQIDSDKRSEVSLNKVQVYTGFDEENNLSTYARFTSPIWDLRSFINQTSICKCIFDRIDINEKNELKLKLSNFKNKINNSSKQDSLQE